MSIARPLLGVEASDNPLFQLVVRERDRGEDAQAQDVEQRIPDEAGVFDRELEKALFHGFELPAGAAAAASALSYAETPTSTSYESFSPLRFRMLNRVTATG